MGWGRPQPSAAPYKAGTHEELLKWKFASMNSVDFLLRRVGGEFGVPPPPSPLPHTPTPSPVPLPPHPYPGAASTLHPAAVASQRSLD